MNVPDAQAITGIVAVTGFTAWITRFFLIMYKESVNKTTETLTTLLQEHRTHDSLSASAHAQSCDALREMTQALRIMNRNGNGKGQQG